MSRRLISLHRNDGNSTQYVVVVAGNNGITAKLYESSWQKAKERADEAKISPFCVDAYAINTETDTIYRP